MQGIWYYNIEVVKKMKVDKYTQIRMKMIEKKIYWKDIIDEIGYSNWGLRLAIKNNNSEIIKKVEKIIDDF